jgi:hypothetical protein
MSERPGNQFIVGCCGVALILAALGLFPKWTVDDAYISFRYAHNLAAHGEFTFNVGEDPVEGYTGVLHPVAITLAMLSGIAPEIAAHALGILAFFVLLAVFHRILGRLRISSSCRLPAFFLFASAPILYTHVFSGLETITFTALLLASARQLHAIVASGSVRFSSCAVLSALLLLLTLCRPEGIAYAVIALIVVFLACVRRRRSLRTFISGTAIFLLLPGAAYFIWRWSYYGFFFPNTFYAKRLTSFSGASFVELAQFCAQYLLLPTLAAITATGVACGGKWNRPRPGVLRFRKKADLLMVGSLLIFALVIAVQYMRSHLFMNFAFRFFVPLYPIALIVLFWFAAPRTEPGQRSGEANPEPGRLVLVIVMTFLISQMALHVLWFFRKEMPFAAKYRTRLSEMARPAGLFLRENVPASEWLAVHYDAGVIPFLSGLKTVDFGRLNDEYLAHHPRASLKDRVNYFFARSPGAAVFTSYAWERVDHGPEADAIISDPRFTRYRLARKFSNSTEKKYHEFVFIRDDLMPGKVL